jgi:hypothetical protein
MNSRAIRVTVEMEIHHLNVNGCARIQAVQPPVHSLSLDLMGCKFRHLSKCISSNNSRCKWLKHKLSRMILRYVSLALRQDSRSLTTELQSLRRQQETEARKAYEKQLHQDQAMRSMQLQQQQQPNGSQAGTPFNPNPQTPLAVTHTLETLSPAQLASTNNGANQNPTQTQTTTATSSPRTTLISGSQQMQRNQSRTTGIGVGSGSMLPPQSPANRTTTPKPVGVGVGVGVGKATPKMMKEELVSHAAVKHS